MEPTQATIKPGFFQSKNMKGGLNLNKWLLQFLKKIGFADTVDCCTYYPTVPQLTNVIDYTGPTDNESENVPSFGIFITVEPNSDVPVVIAWMKAPDGSNHSIWTNN